MCIPLIFLNALSLADARALPFAEAVRAAVASTLVLQDDCDLELIAAVLTGNPSLSLQAILRITAEDIQNFRTTFPTHPKPKIAVSDIIDCVLSDDDDIVSDPLWLQLRPEIGRLNTIGYLNKTLQALSVGGANAKKEATSHSRGRTSPFMYRNSDDDTTSNASISLEKGDDHDNDGPRQKS